MIINTTIYIAKLLMKWWSSLSPYTNEPNHQTSRHSTSAITTSTTPPLHQHHLLNNTSTSTTPPHQQHTACYHLLHITDHHLQSEGHRIENSCPAQLHQIGADAIASNCGLECSLIHTKCVNRIRWPGPSIVHLYLPRLVLLYRLFLGVYLLFLGVYLLFLGVYLLFLGVYLLFLGVYLLFLGVYLLFLGVYLLFLGVYLLFLGVFFCTFYFWVCSSVPSISCLFFCTSYICMHVCISFVSY